MATIIASFDPTVGTGGTGNFNTGLTNGGWLFIHNESPISMLFDLGVNRGNVMVAAQFLRVVKIGIGTDSIKYQTVAQYIQPTNSLLSRVYAEAYQPEEWTGGEMYVPLAGPLYQERIISLPMLTLARGPNRIVLPTDTQGGPLAAQVLAPGANAGTAGTGCFEAIYSVEIQPLTVGECTIALGVCHLTSGGALNGGFITPFGYYDVARAGQFGPFQPVNEVFTTPRYITDAYIANDSRVAIYYYLFDGYGGMTVDISVSWSVCNASSFGLTSITPPGEYGSFLSNSRSVL